MGALRLVALLGALVRALSGSEAAGTRAVAGPADSGAAGEAVSEALGADAACLPGAGDGACGAASFRQLRARPRTVLAAGPAPQESPGLEPVDADAENRSPARADADGESAGAAGADLDADASGIAWLPRSVQKDLDRFHVCGNYCGPGWCGGTWSREDSTCQYSTPASGGCADHCCKQHDMCCSKGIGHPATSHCNTQIVRCLGNCHHLGRGCRGCRPDRATTCSGQYWPWYPGAIEAAMEIVSSWCCGKPCSRHESLAILRAVNGTGDAR